MGPEGQQNDRDSPPAGESTDVLLAAHRASVLPRRGTRFSSKTGADVCSRPSLLSDISLYSESLFKHVPVTVTNENQFDSSDDVDTSHVHHHVHHYLHHSPAEASTSISFKEDEFLPWAEEYPVLTPDFYDVSLNGRKQVLEQKTVHGSGLVRVNKTYAWLPKFDSALARPSLKKL